MGAGGLTSGAHACPPSGLLTETPLQLPFFVFKSCDVTYRKAGKTVQNRHVASAASVPEATVLSGLRFTLFLWHTLVL